MKDITKELVKQLESGEYVFDSNRQFKINHSIEIGGEVFNLDTCEDWTLDDYLGEPEIEINEDNLEKMVRALNKMAKLNEIYFRFGSSDCKFDKTCDNVWLLEDETYFTDLSFRVGEKSIIAEFKFHEDSFNCDKEVKIPIPTYVQL